MGTTDPAAADADVLVTASAAEPTARVSRGWTTRFTLLWLGFWMAWLVPVQLLLPNQLGVVDNAHKVRDFGLINGAAGIAALIVLPLAGALCDRREPGSAGAGPGWRPASWCSPSRSS